MSDDQSSLQQLDETSDTRRQRARRRRFSRLRKMAILAEVERCPALEQVAALLAREGLHGSQLTLWRKQFENSKARALKEPPKRVVSVAELSRTIGILEQQKAELQRQLLLARQLLDLPHPAARTSLTVAR